MTETGLYQRLRFRKVHFVAIATFYTQFEPVFGPVSDRDLRRIGFGVQVP